MIIHKKLLAAFIFACPSVQIGTMEVPPTPKTPRAYPKSNSNSLSALDSATKSLTLTSQLTKSCTALPSSEHFFNAKIANLTSYSTTSTHSATTLARPKVTACNCPLLLVAFLPDNSFLKITYGCFKKTTLYIIKDKNQEAHEIEPQPLEHDEKVLHVVLSSDYKKLLSITKNTLYLWDVVTLKRIGKITPHAISITNANFDATNSYIISCGEDNVINIFSATTLEQIKSFNRSNRPLKVIIEKQDAGESFERVLIGEYNGKEHYTLTFLTTSNSIDQPFSGEPHRFNIFSIFTMKISNDGKFVITSARDKNVKIWSIEPFLPGHKLLCTIATGTVPDAIALSSDNKILAIGSNSSIKLYSLEKFEFYEVFYISEYSLRPLAGMHFNSDNTQLVCFDDKTILTWNLSN